MCKNCVQSFQVHSIRATSRFPSHQDFQALDGLIYAADYNKNPALKAAIRQFKYKFTQVLTPIFSRFMADKLSQLRMLTGKQIILIPVPLHPKRLSYRGFNQAILLAEGIQQLCDAQIHPCLLRTKETSQQAKLSKVERHQNLRAAFQLKNDTHFQKEAVYFLVDDVCTTGSTLEECARVLKQAGLPKVYGLVIARAFK